MSNLNKAWKIWAKTNGYKIGNDRESDIAAIFRSIWVIIHLVTCFFIIAHNGIKLGWF